MAANKVWIPQAGHYGHFHPRERLYQARPERRYRLPAGEGWPTVALPIDWTADRTIPQPMDDNDQLGICGPAMVDHADRGMVANAGNIGATFCTVSYLIAQYLEVAGGDVGTNEAEVTSDIWYRGIGGNPAAIAYDHLDIDPSNAAELHSGIGNFLGAALALSLPDAWIASFNPDGSTIWDAGPGIVADPQKGHYVWLNGVYPDGNINLSTWGGWARITPAGLALCQPAIFVAFSPRQFNPTTGLDPTGASYSAKKSLWVAVGGNGNLIPPWTGPAPGPVVQPPVVPPAVVPPAPPSVGWWDSSSEPPRIHAPAGYDVVPSNSPRIEVFPHLKKVGAPAGYEVV